jgi:tRNA (cytidine/uridine-2'-O-)-methyltransferase
VFHVVFDAPEIPPNTGNAIRLAACTGASLHLVEPLGFTLDDAPLRRAGLDYHDLAHVTVHPDLDQALNSIGSPRVFAFTTTASTRFTEVAYQRGDVLLFGRESVGLGPDVLRRSDVTAQVRIPMLAGRRSLNLSNCAALGIYEAWRQHDFAQ